MEINQPLPRTSLEQASSEFVNPTTSLSDDGFGTDAFLKLFLEQLQNQDPLNPQDTTEMTAQLATLSQVEQALRASESLSGINDRLDTLIEATLGGKQSSLDPVSMIGRNVDVALDRLQVPYGGESARIRIDVNSGGTDFLLIEASDSLGQKVGAAVVANADSDGQRLPLSRGSYELFLDGSTPKIRMPDGSVSQLSFEPLSADENGNVVLSGSTPVPLIAGQTYDFRARATGRDASGSHSTELPMTTTGVVSSVRIVAGQAVLTIGNQEIDLARIIGIR